MNSLFQIIKKVSLVSIFFLSFSCKKVVQVDVPGNRIASESVYSSDATAIAAVTGILTKLSSNSYTGSASIPNISFWLGLSADEFTLGSGITNTTQLSYYKNSLAASAVGGSEFWTNTYPVIYLCNAAIEGLDKTTALTSAVKKQLQGETKFIRALCYFYLTNLYGDVPLALTTDYKITSVLPRSTQTLVYQQIIKDLQDAQDLLNPNYVEADVVTSKSTTERARPNQAAATALLARVYLYTGKWAEAEAQATTIINNNTLYSLSAINSVFLKYSSGNKEAIWQLQPVNNVYGNSLEAPFFNVSSPTAGINTTHPVYLSQNLLSNFEPNDLRRTNGNWVNMYQDVTGTYYYANKYKSVVTVLPSGATTVTPVEYTTILRLGEQYLIRAEARAQQGNISGAQSDLNMIRTRAGLPNTTASTQPALLAAILNERQVELFSELGHRWLDLKRTNNVDAIMTIQTPIKGGAWNTIQQLYPVPLSEILKDVNLTQNTGY